jgi:type II secretory pathway predicted ATPase ExeA
MYEKHFRLRELPFNLTPDPRFLYSHPSCQEAFATLCYGVENRKGIVLITGAAGTGKTTLIKLFMEKAVPRVRAACILDPHLTFIELLQCALDAFGVTQLSGDRVCLIQQFRDFLLEQLTHDQRVALLLDESQDIDDEVLEELRLVSDLEHAGDKLVQLVLAGQSEFESRLDQPKFHQLRQRVTLRSRLESLGEAEIASYIDFRLQTAGYSGRSMFQHAAVQRIGHFSEGIPRLINVICDHALLIASATALEKIGAETIDEIADDLHLEGSGSKVKETPRLPRWDDIPLIVPQLENARASDRFQAVANGAPVLQSGPSKPSDPAPVWRSIGNVVKIFRKRSWAEVSAAVASIAVFIFGGMYLAGAGKSSPTTNSIGSIHEGLAPLSRELYRALGRGASWQAPVKGTQPSYTDLERGEKYDRFEEEKVSRDRGNSGESGQKLASSGRSDRSPTVDNKRASPERQNAQTRRPDLSASGFAVIENSYVREKPASKAEVIATLRPGTRIQVVGRAGEYFRVRSLDNEAIRGYVHKEDAFFEPYH